MQRCFSMKVVVDANILVSALLKKGLTRQGWFDLTLDLVAPAFIIREFLKHKAELRRRYGGSAEEFDGLVSRLLSHVRLVDDAALQLYKSAAMSLSADPDDWLYLACALSEGAAIWSHDKDFGGQRRVRVVSTAELAREVGLL